MSNRKRFDLLVARYKKAEAFYADPNESQAKKDAWRPEMEALVDELGEVYCKLLAEGIAGPGDLPEATEGAAQMIFDARDVTGDFDIKQFEESWTIKHK